MIQVNNHTFYLHWVQVVHVHFEETRYLHYLFKYRSIVQTTVEVSVHPYSRRNFIQISLSVTEISQFENAGFFCVFFCFC